MKIYLIILLATACLSCTPNATDERTTPDAVVVKVLRTPLPHDEDKREKFLWDTFANKPEEKKFGSYGTEAWKDNFTDFAKALVDKAAGEKLDSVSLRKVFDLLLENSKDKIAYLPVGAYQTTLDGKPIWIVTVKWEYTFAGERLKLVHICAFAFDQKSLERVAFMTCG